ncbi:MAG: hypothetical protein KF744_06790 [Taibaiella sp.]|nr:hypothetical protein [Taibaiella sp.]
MKKVIFLSTLALAAVTTFAQSQNTTTKSTSQTNAAPVQNISATMHDLKKNEAAQNAQKQPAKKTDAKKADANKTSNAAAATKTSTNATK